MNGQFCRQKAREGGIPGDKNQQDQARHQHEPATGGYEQALERTLSCLGIFMVEADQHVGSDAGQFPEHKKGNEIVRKHQSKHGCHERQHDDIEPGEVFVAFQVRTGVDQNEGADAADQKGKHQGQAIDHEVQGYPEPRHPGRFNQEPFTTTDRGNQAGEVSCEGSGEQSQYPANVTACQTIKRRYRDRQQKTG